MLGTPPTPPQTIHENVPPPPPQIIDTLLDVRLTPNKPQYMMASEVPLVLFDCEYAGVDWIYEIGVYLPVCYIHACAHSSLLFWTVFGAHMRMRMYRISCPFSLESLVRSPLWSNEDQTPPLIPFSFPAFVPLCTDTRERARAHRRGTGESTPLCDLVRTKRICSVRRVTVCRDKVG